MSIIKSYFKKNDIKFIDTLIKNSSDSKRLEYQIVGEILNNVPPKTILSDLKSNTKYLWNHPMYSDIKSKLFEYDNFLIKPFEVTEGVIECFKCKSKRTFSYQKQTRSADEPFTTFCTCMQCGNKWQYSG